MIGQKQEWVAFRDEGFMLNIIQIRSNYFVEGQCGKFITCSKNKDKGVAVKDTIDQLTKYLMLKEKGIL